MLEDLAHPRGRPADPRELLRGDREARDDLERRQRRQHHHGERHAAERAGPDRGNAECERAPDRRATGQRSEPRTEAGGRGRCFGGRGQPPIHVGERAQSIVRGAVSHQLGSGLQ